ncbi:MAG: deoxynucleoside kinase [Bacteroidales bacterium]|nr:deoxynucleoside kinase [Bacteroidales bacterium]MBP5765009.1 deoxynucleoside kinase [Bacteroidales bacterium]
MHIVIAGNIGSGKTTLTRMLAKHYDWEPKFEAVSFNPYLEDYYKDIGRWSFAMEVFFLKERCLDIIDIARSGRNVIQDRSIFEGVYVFVANNYAQGNLSKRDYETFMDLFDQIKGLIRKPDLMIYLRASLPHLIGNIQKRGREYEQAIQIDYLEGLNRRYDEFIGNHYDGKVLTLDKDSLDFEHNPLDFRTITDKVEQQLFGLF